MAKPKQNTVMLKTYVTPELAELLQKKAYEKGGTTSGLLREIIIAWKKEQEKTEK